MWSAHNLSPIIQPIAYACFTLVGCPAMLFSNITYSLTYVVTFFNAMADCGHSVVCSPFQSSILSASARSALKAPLISSVAALN